eukprot:gene5806-7866_t
MLNAFIWGVSWWPFRQLHDAGLHPLWATVFIFTLAVLVIGTLRPAAWAELFRHPSLWVILLAAGTTNATFNWGVAVGDVVRVVLLFYLMPAWAVLVAWLMLGERPTQASLMRLLLAMVGVLIVLKTPDSPWPIPQSVADWLALMGGLSFAITNALLRKFEKTYAGVQLP